MLPVPLLPSPQAAQAPDAKGAKSDPAAKPEEGGAFGQLLDTVTDGPLPADLRAEMLKQVQDGVPLNEVLANLLERLRDETDLALTPGMLPVLQAMAPQVALPDEGLALRLAVGRGSQTLDQPAEAMDGLEPEADLLADLDAGDLPQADQLLGKHKALLAGRVTAVESLTNAVPAANAIQSGALRALELPSAMAPLQGTSTDAVSGRLEQLSLSPRVGDPQWGQALAQRIVWMVGQDKQVAELRLNPANLGPLEVKLTLHHDQASVSLLASTGAVRDALEQALPRLRDMLGQQDIQLVQVDVGQRQAPQDGRAEAGGDGRQQNAQAGASASGLADDDQTEQTPLLRMQSNGLIDAYA